MRMDLPDAKRPGQFEDLADGDVGEQSHRENQPKHDFMSQGARSRIDSPGGRKRLPNVLGTDNVLKSRQSIENPTRLIGGQRAKSVRHASRSLLVTSVVDNPR